MITGDLSSGSGGSRNIPGAGSEKVSQVGEWGMGSLAGGGSGCANATLEESSAS